jgi:hypothetical protein
LSSGQSSQSIMGLPSATPNTFSLTPRNLASAALSGTMDASCIKMLRMTLATAGLLIAPLASCQFHFNRLGAEPRDQLRCDWRSECANVRSIAFCLGGRRSDSLLRAHLMYAPWLLVPSTQRFNASVFWPPLSLHHEPSSLHRAPPFTSPLAAGGASHIGDPDSPSRGVLHSVKPHLTTPSYLRLLCNMVV